MPRSSVIPVLDLFYVFLISMHSFKRTIVTSRLYLSVSEGADVNEHLDASFQSESKSQISSRYVKLYNIVVFVDSLRWEECQKRVLPAHIITEPHRDPTLHNNRLFDEGGCVSLCAKYMLIMTALGQTN